jgi:hypothetical protein
MVLIVWDNQYLIQVCVRMGSLLVPKITLSLDAKGLATDVQKALKSLVDEMMLSLLNIRLVKITEDRSIQKHQPFHWGLKGLGRCSHTSDHSYADR